MVTANFEIMQDYKNHSTSATPSPSSMTPTPSFASTNIPHPSAAPTSVDDLARVFNTALVSTHAQSHRNLSQELHELMENPAFRAILNSVRQYSRLQGIPERQACEQIIQTFRKMDAIWSDYVFQEGVEKLRNPAAGSNG